MLVEVGGINIATLTEKMSKLKAVALLALFACVLQANAFSSFQDKIPNGNKIPHPCKPNTIWHGVGHLNEIGGGKRNPFGLAFKAAGFKWTKALCQADSDQDGKTNGEELGDPGCTWSVGGPAPTGSAKSHPGVCEPVDSTKCKSQTWISCSGTKFNCSSRTEPGVITRTVRMPRTKVPARVTTYYCKTFLLPHDKDYHIVATEPFLDNKQVIHHMILYGCKEDMVIEKDPFNCIMGSEKCYDMLAGWTVGDEGQCSPMEAGYRFGKSVYKYMQLQVHWTNERKLTNLYDSSGLKLYYTPKLRQFDLGTFATGQLHLELPPGKKEVVTNGVCTGGCTKTMLTGHGPINITGALLHAHFLGKNLSLAQYRNGKFIRFLSRDDVFSYNNPTTTAFNPPVLLYPGDEIRTKCIYDTTKRTTTTYYGDGTFDEMCFGFIHYYPKFKAAQQELCYSFERYTFCDIYAHFNASFYTHKFGTCNFTAFESTGYLSDVIQSCGPHKTKCTKGCKFYLDRMDSHRCMKGYERTIYDGILYNYSKILANSLWTTRNLCAKGVHSAAATIMPWVMFSIVVWMAGLFAMF